MSSNWVTAGDHAADFIPLLFRVLPYGQKCIGTFKRTSSSTLSVVDSREFCSLHKTKPRTFSVSYALSTAHLQCKKNHRESRQLAAFQVFKFTPLAVSFMEIDSLIRVREGLGMLCRIYLWELHRRTKKEAEQLQIRGEVQGMQHFSIQMSNDSLILFNNSHTVSIRPWFVEHEYSSFPTYHNTVT